MKRNLIWGYLLFFSLFLQSAHATNGCINSLECPDCNLKLYTEATVILGSEMDENGTIVDSSLITKMKLATTPDIQNISIGQGLYQNQEILDAKVDDSNGRTIFFYPAVPPTTDNCRNTPECVMLSWHGDSNSCYELQYTRTNFLKAEVPWWKKSFNLQPYPFDEYFGNFSYAGDTPPTNTAIIYHRYQVTTKNIMVEPKNYLLSLTALCPNLPPISAVLPSRKESLTIWAEDYAYYEIPFPTILTQRDNEVNFTIISQGRRYSCESKNASIIFQLDLVRPFFPSKFLFYLMVTLTLVLTLIEVYKNRASIFKKLDINQVGAVLEKLYFTKYPLLEIFLIVELVDTILTFPARPPKLSLFELTIAIPILLLSPVIVYYMLAKIVCYIYHLAKSITLKLKG